MRKMLLSREGAKRLREELQYLRRVERPRAIAAISDARDSVDDATYAHAVDQRELIDRRIAELQNKLNDAAIVDVDAERESSIVEFGALVTLRPEPQGESVQYRLVGDGETDIPTGRLSVSTPLARGLLGREEGELVSVETPSGSQTWRIVEVRYGAYHSNDDG